MKNIYTKVVLSTFFFCLSLVFHGYGQTENCPASMIHYWYFDETSGTGPYSDLFGLDADCSNDMDIDCPVPISDLEQIGPAALNFFQGDSYGVDIPDDDSFDFGADDSFTIEFWMHSDASVYTENQVIIGRDNRNGGSGLHWWIGIEGDQGNGTSDDGTLRFQLRDINDDGASPYIGGSGTKVNDNAWHHIAAVRDDATGQNRIYLDGNLYATSSSFNYTGGFAETDVKVTLGHLYDPTTNERFFYNGKLDELAVHNVALSQSDIAAHYSVGNPNNATRYRLCSSAPTITSTPPSLNGKIGNLYTYDVEANGDPPATFTLENSPPTGMSIDEATGVIEWTPTTGQDGMHSFRIRATNAIGNDFQDVTLDIDLENEPPVFTKGADQAVDEDAGAQEVTGWATGIDDGDGTSQVLTFNVTNNTNSGIFSAGPSIDGETGDLTYTPADDANGTATITIELEDAGGAVSATQSFDIVINPINDAPSFTIGPDQTTTSDAGLTIIQGWATNVDDGDPGPSENQVLTFEIIGNNNVGLFTSLPSINAVGDLSFTPQEGTSGVANITVRLVDNGDDTDPNVNTSDEQTFDITISEATGIELENVSTSLSVYPNPSSDQKLKLRFENSIYGSFNIKIYDLSGKSLYEKLFDKKTKLVEQELNVDGIHKGIYLVRLYNDNFVAEKKIIIN